MLQLTSSLPSSQLQFPSRACAFFSDHFFRTLLLLLLPQAKHLPTSLPCAPTLQMSRQQDKPSLQDLLDIGSICSALSQAVHAKDLPAWRLVHPLCTAAADDRLTRIQLSTEQLHDAADFEFVGLKHVTRAELDTADPPPKEGYACCSRQENKVLETPDDGPLLGSAVFAHSWRWSLPLAVEQLPKLNSFKVRRTPANCKHARQPTSRG